MDAATLLAHRSLWTREEKPQKAGLPLLTASEREAYDVLLREPNARLEQERPLYFDHPHDQEAWLHPIQWMLGDDLLVAPVIEADATVWQVYLPAGEWVDASSGEAFAGPRVITVEVPLDRIPVFLRESALERLGGLFRE